jgi:hypothetical protein
MAIPPLLAIETPAISDVNFRLSGYKNAVGRGIASQNHLLTFIGKGCTIPKSLYYALPSIRDNVLGLVQIFSKGNNYPSTGQDLVVVSGPYKTSGRDFIALAEPILTFTSACKFGSDVSLKIEPLTAVIRNEIHPGEASLPNRTSAIISTLVRYQTHSMLLSKKSILILRQPIMMQVGSIFSRFCNVIISRLRVYFCLRCV